MIFNTYKKYILTTFSKILLEVTLIFLCLVLITNIFEEITFFKNVNVTGFYTIFIASLNTPSIVFDILPFIFLISTQLFFINISDKNELFIFKYNGLTNHKILGILVIFSFFLGILLILSYYNFSAKLKNHYLEIKNDFTSDKKYLAVITQNGFWIKDEINKTISITNADKINKNYLINVSIVQFDNNFELLKTIQSPKIDIQNKDWVIKDATVTIDNTSKKFKSLLYKSNFDLEKINSLFSNLSSMSLIKLHKIKKDYFSLGYSTTDIKVFEYKIYSLPIYLAIMTLLAGIIMFNSKHKKNKTFNVILGILLSVIIYYFNFFSGLLGSNGKIPIFLSVLLPLVILILISSIGLVRLNEK